MAIHNTLDEALAEIAERSFYEDATATPVNGCYEVSDDFGTSYAGDNLYWTYAGGIEDPKDILDRSRLMETYETFTTAAHIRYHMDRAIERLNDGKSVTFAYAIVEAYPEDGEPDDEDYSVGWCLLAYAV